jgi:iron complex outermembrane receptor protein
LQSGVRLLPDITFVSSFIFFSNATNTRTIGLDIVLTGNWNIAKTTLQPTLAANINKTDLYGATQYAKNLPDDENYRNLLVNREERCRVEDAFPRDKIIFNIAYFIGKWKLNLNFTRYGKISQKQNDPKLAPDEEFSPKILTSLNICYKISSWLSLTAGAENIGDIYPDKYKHRSNTANGLQPYSFNFAAFGVNGGYYFINMSFNFLNNKKSHP